MKLPRFLLSALLAPVLTFAATPPPAPVTTSASSPTSTAPVYASAKVPTGDYTEDFDTLYNNLTVQRTGTVVELRARSRKGLYIESAVDLADPLNLQVAYSRTLFAASFFLSAPKRVVIIGLGGASFHRVFAATWPDSLLQTVELDDKVFELCQTRLDFKPTANTPVTIADGRMWVKRDSTKWDWLILDAFRGGYVPPHLKTQEFYQECAARLADQGVFVSNLHEGTELYNSDIKTIQSVFPQLVLFNSVDTGNVIAVAVKYKTPLITDPAKWPAAADLGKVFKGRVDLPALRAERIEIPVKEVAAATVLTDDFSPVEFQNVIKTNDESKLPSDQGVVAP